MVLLQPQQTKHSPIMGIATAKIHATCVPASRNVVWNEDKLTIRVSNQARGMTAQPKRGRIAIMEGSARTRAANQAKPVLLVKQRWDMSQPGTEHANTTENTYATTRPRKTTATINEGEMQEQSR